jgi:hypothetical protein
MRHVLASTGLLGCLFAVGCNEGAVSLHYHEDAPPPPPAVVYVDRGHICGPGCGHYWDGGRYVVVTRGHRHGPGCGHVLTDNRWVVAVSGPHGNAVVAHGDVHPAPVRAVRIPPPPGRADYYVYSRSGSKWVKVRAGHRHGPGCGHIVVDGHWCLD